MKAKFIIILAFAILFVIILLQNTQVITFQFLFWKISMSRVLFLPLVLLIGFLLGYFTDEFRRKHKEKIIKSKESKSID